MTSILDAGQEQKANLVDPSVLARIGNLEMRAKVVVEGFIQGLHRAPKLGASTDFAEHRPYMPGDDLRRMDWRLYARTDRFYVKEFEADTNTNLLVVLDVSASMRYGAKLRYASTLAACLAYFSSLQRDRVGLVTFADGIVDYVPPSAKHLRLVLHSLDQAERRTADPSRSLGMTKAAPGTTGSAPGTRYREVFRRLADTVRRRSMVAIISDLYEEPDDIVAAVNELRGRGNDMMVLHVLDPSELEFPFEESANFEDLETGARMPIVPDYLRDDYRALVAKHIDTLGRRLGGQNVDYALFDTAQPMDKALFRYLGARLKLERARKVG
jgi:uncharacterized protein (DUF58 family)